MKKIGLAFLMIAIMLVIVACGNSGSESTEAKEQEGPKEVIEESTQESIQEAESEVDTEVDAPVEDNSMIISEQLSEPVETNPPNTDFTPAFEGQTRVNGVKTVTEYKVEKIASGLNSPWGIAALPNGSFAITEKGGTLRILSESGELSEPINGFPEVASGGQGGLLDVIAAPDFSENKTLYFTFSEPSSEGTLTAVGKGNLSEEGNAVNDFTVIYRAIPYYKSQGHYGSRIAIDLDGNLFISTGDRQNSANRMRVQELDNGHGKVIHITPSGESVSEGYFEDALNASPEIYSYGHRNVQGLDIHPETGELWASEMGPQGGDELNLILPGKNYGWPFVSYGEEYSGADIGEGIAVLDDTEQPVYYWDPVIAPSGMTFYSSDEMPEWKNNLFIGGLRGQHIARLIIDSGKVIGEERLLSDLNERFRDVEEGLDGALYTITDSGNIYRIGK